MKDTVNMTRMISLEIDFVADDPGLQPAALPSSRPSGRGLHGPDDL
jgi:hypothetical protein